MNPAYDRNVQRFVVVLLAVAGCKTKQPAVQDAPRVAVDAPAEAMVDADDPLPRIGCADGEREGFLEPLNFPTIAPCRATWAGDLDLRATPTGAACGDDLGPCAAPADACAAGWHICATSGDVTELLVISGAGCRSLMGRFVAAASHCAVSDPACGYPAAGQFTCPSAGLDCTQPICCGSGCDSPACIDGVWPGDTHENASDGPPCGALPASTVDGVLCCKT